MHKYIQKLAEQGMPSGLAEICLYKYIWECSHVLAQKLCHTEKSICLPGHLCLPVHSNMPAALPQESFLLQCASRQSHHCARSCHQLIAHQKVASQAHAWKLPAPPVQSQADYCPLNLSEHIFDLWPAVANSHRSSDGYASHVLGCSLDGLAELATSIRTKEMGSSPQRPPPIGHLHFHSSALCF